MASVDLFRQIDQLFRGEAIEGGPIFMWTFHRFLVSDPLFAATAKDVNKNIHDDSLAQGFWQVAVPRTRKAPYFRYAGPKKGPAAAELEKKIMMTENLSPADAADVVGMIGLMKMEELALAHYGIDAPKTR